MYLSMSILINSITAIGYYWHDRWVYRLASLSLLDDTNFFWCECMFFRSFQTFYSFCNFYSSLFKENFMKKNKHFIFTCRTLLWRSKRKKLQWYNILLPTLFLLNLPLLFWQRIPLRNFYNNICKICIRHVIISNHVCKW